MALVVVLRRFRFRLVDPEGVRAALHPPADGGAGRLALHCLQAKLSPCLQDDTPQRAAPLPAGSHSLPPHGQALA